MNEMIERIAKTISDEGQLRRHGYIFTPYRHSSMDQNFINDYLAIAKAVIKAMREPTEDMVETSAWNAPAGEIIGHVQIKYAWYEMIDKALEE